MFAEYRRVEMGAPLSQGDILEKTSEEAGIWNRHLLVLTADCDFANAKNGGRVTCVPLLSKNEYLLNFPCEAARLAAISDILAYLQSELSGLGHNLSSPRFEEWVLDEEPHEVLQALGLDQDSADRIEKILEAIELLSSRQTKITEAIEAIVRAKGVVPAGKSAKNLRDALRSKVLAPFKNPPGDSLFISAIGPKSDVGYFAYLRHLEQVWQPAIALGPSHQSADYRRIARLNETYTHMLSQRFALVYMSIGLPDEYEETRNLHHDLLNLELT